MVLREHTVTYWTFESEVRPEITTTNPELGKVIAWADTHPVAWNIVTGTRSKLFGRWSSTYLGWSRGDNAAKAVLERLRCFKEIIEEEQNCDLRRMAQFTLAHYRDKGFCNGLFEQYDNNDKR